MTDTSRINVNELDFMKSWIQHILRMGSDSGGDWEKRIKDGLPLSFRFGDKESADILCEMQWDMNCTEVEGSTSRYEIVGLDASSGLECKIELVGYSDFPAVEWVLHFTNTSETDSPMLSDLFALDMTWTSPGITPELHYSRGSDERPDDFEYISGNPLKQLRMPSKTVRLNSGTGSTPLRAELDGRSSVDWLPFFNLQSGEDGLFVAIGWSGQWVAEFAHDGEGNTRIRAGMEYLNLSLSPGESIRSTRILLLHWQGDLHYAQNMLRQFILKYHTPYIDGKPAVAPLSMGSWGGSPTAEHIELIEKIRTHRLPYDYYWVDAGWYGTGTDPCPDVFHGDWGITGDWQVNKHRHPNGLNPIVEAARETGMKFLLWIEPLRATYNTPVTLEHPEWFLSLTGNPPQPNESLLLNLGQPEACDWAIETVSRLIHEIGIDCYREDFNFFGSLECFLRTDPPGKQGITEIRFIEGLYRFWDELRHRHPKLLIDNCASGGRRIDLETMSRSIPLWRTDFTCFAPVNPSSLQVATCGLANWVPLNGTSSMAETLDTYQFRSGISAAMQFSIDEFGLMKGSRVTEEDWEWHRKMMEEFLKIRPLWYGDYYQLMNCTLSEDTWMAYQLHRSDLDEGMVLAFRREKSPLTVANFEIKGKRSGRCYEYNDADTGEVWRSNSSVLTVEIPTPRTSRLIFYKGIK